MSDNCCIDVVTVDTPTIVTVPQDLMVVTVGIQGPQGSPGISSLVTGVCGANIALGIAVVLVSGLLYPADPTDVTQAGLYVGVSTQAGLTTQTINVAQLGEVTTSGLTTGSRYFVDLLGVLSASPVFAGRAWLRYVGTALSATKLILVSSVSIELD